MARVETMTYQDSLDSQYLSNSFSALSRSRSTNNLIVRTYKQATQLYLTKRFKEALETLEPIISAQPSTEQSGDTNGDAAYGPAPIAQSSRGTRTRVWVFYLSLVHAIIDMGQEEGRNVFGSTTWRKLASKAREGTIWEEVVQCGYGGEEGEVDADVVVNLATLLLGHMQDQRMNQQRLETFLSTADGGGGVNGHLAFGQDGISTPMSNSSSSPKMLQTRLKILELYALHVLPANEEWDYASSFIEMNDMLDEERKEAFMNALQSLREERDGTAQRERELKAQREREMEEQRRQEEQARRRDDAAQKESDKRRAAEADKQRAATIKAPNGNAAATPARASTIPTSSHAPRPSSKPQKKPPSPPPPTFYRRASCVLNNMQHMVRQAGRNMNVNSLPLLRFLMFMVAILLIVTRRDLRVKLRRAIDGGWVKVKQTVGMGVKVSYI